MIGHDECDRGPDEGELNDEGIQVRGRPCNGVAQDVHPVMFTNALRVLSLLDGLQKEVAAAVSVTHFVQQDLNRRSKTSSDQIEGMHSVVSEL